MKEALLIIGPNTTNGKKLKSIIRESSFKRPVFSSSAEHMLNTPVNYTFDIHAGLKTDNGLPRCSYDIIRRFSDSNRAENNTPLTIKQKAPGISTTGYPSPDVEYELMFSEFDPPTKKTAIKILTEWVNCNDWFPLARSGRPDTNLIKLVAYRFTQGHKDKPYNLIRFELEKSKITPTK